MWRSWRFWGAGFLAGAAMAAQAARASGLTTLYNFTGGDDGGYSEAPLLFHHGLLYGTSNIGGIYGAGTVFSVNASTGGETVLYSFTGGADGGNPVTGLVLVAGSMYGTTFAGGARGKGTIFRIDPRTGRQTVLYSFPHGADGGHRHSGLIVRGNFLYGTSSGDGSGGHGTVFRLDPASGDVRVVHDFAGGRDGATPVGELLSVGRYLYGTTLYGGAFASGTVFRLDPASGAESVLHDFNGGRDGANPNAALIWRSGALYGTTIVGGATNSGTVFKINPVTGDETTLHSFGGYGNGSDHPADGADPLGGLLNIDGALYGTTSAGVTCDFSPACGTLFRIAAGSGRASVGYKFSGGIDGGRPYDRLIYVHGALYGTTSIGGRWKWGTVFRFDP